VGGRVEKEAETEDSVLNSKDAERGREGGVEVKVEVDEDQVVVAFDPSSDLGTLSGPCEEPCDAFGGVNGGEEGRGREMEEAMRRRSAKREETSEGREKGGRGDDCGSASASPVCVCPWKRLCVFEGVWRKCDRRDCKEEG